MTLATDGNVTDPGSGMASPRVEKAGAVSYGKRFPSTVVGASGSLASRKSDQARRPSALPKRRSSASSARAERTSLPPPRPKMPPISEASAITSVAFQGCGVWSNAVYSPGISIGSELILAM